MESLSQKGEIKLKADDKTDKDAEIQDQKLACNHVIVNLKKDTSKKSKKRNQGGIYLCVMCGEKLSYEDKTQSDKKATKKSKSKKEGSKLVVDELALRRESSTLSDISSDSVDSPSYTRRKESKFSLFGSRRSTASLNKSIITQETVEVCPMHSHKKLKYFCENHQEICCSVCVNCLHPKCDRVMHIEDEIDINSETERTDFTFEALQNVKRGFEEIIDINCRTKSSLEKQKKETRDRRNQMRVHLMKLLDDFERKSEKQMEKFMSIEIQALNSVIDTCNDALSSISKSLEMLEYAQDTKDSHNIFVATHKAIGQKPNLAVALSEAIKNTKDVNIDFIPVSNIDNLENLKSIGEICFSAEEMELPRWLMKSVSKIQKPDIRSPRSLDDIRTQGSNHDPTSPRQPSNVGKYSVRLTDDNKSCDNVGITVIPDGRIAISDLNNWTVKVFDSKFRSCESLKLTSAPRGLVAISPQELAVSLPDESKIQIISASKTLRMLRSILTQLPCYALANHDQELVLLCYDGFSTVAVQFIDLEGNILRKIEMKTSRNKTQLTKSWSLTVNPDGQKLCIGDGARLLCMDLSGNTIFVFKHESLVNIRDVTIDTTGKFYVCGSKSVHRVSPDGTRSKVILTEDDIASPYAICFDPDKRSLLISSTGSDVVSVFQLKKVR